MLKRDGFQPADPALFNAALASASATLSQQARSSASGSTFLRAKRRDSFLAHTAIPVPETQRRSLTVSPGSETLLFDEEMLGVVVSQVQQSSLISSNLAMSRSLARGIEVVPPPPLLWILPLRVPPTLADRISSALLLPLAPEAVSAFGEVRGRLLLPDLRVSGSRSHHLA